MTKLMLSMVPTLNRTHDSSLYTCGTDSMFGFSYEPSFIIYGPRAPTMSSKPPFKAWDKSLAPTLN